MSSHQKLHETGRLLPTSFLRKHASGEALLLCLCLAELRVVTLVKAIQCMVVHYQPMGVRDGTQALRFEHQVLYLLGHLLDLYGHF